MNDNLRRILDQQVSDVPFGWIDIARALRRLKFCEFTPELARFIALIEDTVKPTRIKDREDWMGCVRREGELRNRYFELFKSGVIAELLRPGGMYCDERNLNVPDPISFSRALSWSLNCNDPMRFLKTVYEMMCQGPDIVFECRYLDPTDRYFQLAIAFLRASGSRKPDWVEKYPPRCPDNFLQTPWFVSALEKVEKVEQPSTEEELTVVPTRGSVMELRELFDAVGRRHIDDPGLSTVILTPTHPPLTFSYQIQLAPARGGVHVELYISEDSRRNGVGGDWVQYKLNHELLMFVIGHGLAQYVGIDVPLSLAVDEPLTDSVFVSFEDLSPNKFFYID